MLNFSFSEKRLGLVSLSHFVYDFWRNMFLMLHSINWPNSIVWYHLYFSKYWATCVLRLFANQALTSKNLKLTLSLLSSRFAIWPKIQGKNLNILRTKRAFEVKWKAFLIIFKGLIVAKNCLRPESEPLTSCTYRAGSGDILHMQFSTFESLI